MAELILAILAFLATHAIPALKPVRAGLVGWLGERPYLVLYSVLSLATLFWLGFAFADAPYVEIWPYEPWTRWVPVLVMPLACLLLAGALSSPNPLSIAVGKRPFDPARPGIVSITRHPLMWTFILWAGAHLVPNGDLASILLFGLLLGLSLAGPPSLDAKRRAVLGRGEWARRAAATSNIPFAAILRGRVRLDWRGIGPQRLLAAVCLYGLLLFGHGAAIGVSALPL